MGTIDEAVERLRALPAPLDVPCFVASLPRPLAVAATLGTFSAQPAAGPAHPRLFLFSGGLVITVVGGGSGAELIEFGQWVTPTRTLKGEVFLPQDGGAPDLDPFARLQRQPGLTSCGLCHREEHPAHAVDGGFVSLAYRPEPGTEVSLASLRQQRAACTADALTSCSLLEAVFDVGDVKAGAFGREVERFLP